MNRSDFQKLSRVRAHEAGVLLRARCYHGSYYLAGYAVECALKACIAKKTRRYDYPPSRKVVENYYTHDLKLLLKGSGLETDFDRDRATRPALDDNWTQVKDWSEQARYQKKSPQEARDLFQAVTDPQDGILPWLQARW